MGCYRIHFLLCDKTRSTRYNIPRKDRYSTTIFDWTLDGLNSTVENSGTKVVS